ncbi:MAG: hypothetical protein JWL70_3100 [Acidimicrobiia bacterium]|nr:hypothetical protein [Acidimicrobiia bacterium]
MEEASQQTGLDDFGDIPFFEPLDVLLEALQREANLDDARRQTAANTILGQLVKRLVMVNDRKLYPAIAQEQVKAPLFIVGPPRTGSTHLHALMGNVESVRVPMYWEMLKPSPPPEAATYTTDPRIAEVQAVVDQLPEELLKRHPIHPTRPEQCNMLNDWGFINQAMLASYEIPSYRDWLFNADYSPAYETHRRTLQHLQWRTPGQWVLKYPKHLLTLDFLLKAYPDARFVWTHRDPAVVIPSVCSFTGYMRAQATSDFDAKRYGREWTILEEMVLHRGISVRDRLTTPEQNMDVTFGDLMADPVGTVESICQYFDIECSNESSRLVDKWVSDHPRTQHGVHSYQPEDFGLSTQRLHERFAFYMERFGVQPDRKA